MGRKVKNDLGLIETMVDKRLPQAGVYVSAEQRIKKMHYTMITKEFCDTMNEINAIQTNYQVPSKVGACWMDWWPSWWCTLVVVHGCC